MNQETCIPDRELRCRRFGKLNSVPSQGQILLMIACKEKGIAAPRKRHDGKCSCFDVDNCKCR